MKHYDYMTHNTCSQVISFDLDGETVRNIHFLGGCEENLKAIPRLLEGCTVGQIEQKLRGITCGRRGTSCSDKLAIAVRQALDNRLQEAAV